MDSVQRNIFLNFSAHVTRDLSSIATGKTLVAVSGGVDSTVLAHLMHRAGYDFGIAHVNFGLREDAKDDARWVAQLAEQLDVPFYAQSFSTREVAQKEKISIQLAARKLRYRWFADLANKEGYQQIATAHHADDQVETVLRHFVKGTGIAGMRGILPQQKNITRPLLFVTKQEVLDYALAHAITWREDHSNKEVKYDRNWIRHQIIPPIKKLNPRISITTKTTVAKLRHVEEIYQEHVAKWKQRVWSVGASCIHIDINALREKPWAPMVIFEWLKPIGFAFTDIQGWWKKQPQPGKRLHSSTHWLLSDRGCWLLGEHKMESSINFLMLPTTSWIQTPHYTLHCSSRSMQEEHFNTSSSIASLDLAKLTFPLTLRGWKPGDCFQPLGMQHKKKVSDFLTEQKLSLHEKESVHVVTSHGEIVWVVGMRIDERYKLNPTVQEVYQLVVEPRHLGSRARLPSSISSLFKTSTSIKDTVN
jgi:tRNA(Ile)-lysidine synthase